MSSLLTCECKDLLLEPLDLFDSSLSYPRRSPLSFQSLLFECLLSVRCWEYKTKLLPSRSCSLPGHTDECDEKIFSFVTLPLLNRSLTQGRDEIQKWRK